LRNCCFIISVPSIVFYFFFLLSSFNKSYQFSANIQYNQGTILAVLLFATGMVPVLKDAYQRMCMDYSSYCYHCSLSNDATDCTIAALDAGKSCFFYDYDYNLVCGDNKSKLGIMMAIAYSLIAITYIAATIALGMFQRSDPPQTTTMVVQTSPVVTQAPQIVVAQPSIIVQQPQYIQQPQFIQQPQYVIQPNVQYVQQQPNVVYI